MTTIPPELKNAYKIFNEELQKHLDFFEKSIALFDSSNVLADRDIFSEIVKRLHLIKGGAGFFKITELATLAAKGESYFENNPALENGQNELRAITNQLKQFL